MDDISPGKAGLTIADKTLEVKAPIDLLTGDNLFQNETIQEFRFVVNGKDTTISNLRINGIQCLGG